MDDHVVNSLADDTERLAITETPQEIHLTDTTDTTAAAKPPLLTLLAEIKNCIFEMILPAETIISLRANISRKTGKRQIRLYPDLPALYATWRQLRAEFPIALYYSSNNFVILDQVLQLGLITAFLRARNPAIDCVARVRVSHVVRGYVPGSGIRGGYFMRYGFDAKSIGPGQIALTANKRLDLSDAVDMCFDGQKDGVCLRTVRRLATDGGRTLLEMVGKYAKVLERRMDRSRDALPRVDCASCGKGKFV